MLRMTKSKRSAITNVTAARVTAPPVEASLARKVADSAPAPAERDASRLTADHGDCRPRDINVNANGTELTLHSTVRVERGHQGLLPAGECKPPNMSTAIVVFVKRK